MLDFMEGYENKAVFLKTVKGDNYVAKRLVGQVFFSVI